MFLGSYNSENKPIVVIQFAWKMNYPDDPMYAISSLPSTKIRINFDERAVSPTIKFKWTSSDSKDIQELMDNNIIYAVLTIREKDWPTDIQLPMNNKTP